MSDGHEHLPVVGYCDPLSAAPGEGVDIMVSTTADTVEIDLVRLWHGDPTPGGPGLRYDVVVPDAAGVYAGGVQELRLGSYVLVAPGPSPTSAMTLAAWVRPTVHGRGPAGVITRWDSDARRGHGLFVEPEGDVSLRVDDVILRTGAPLELGRWTFVAAVVGPSGVELVQRPLRSFPADPSAVRITRPVPPFGAGEPPPLVIGGHVNSGGAVGTFNGKISAPVYYDRALDPDELARLANSDPPPGAMARWRLSAGADPTAIPDASGNGHHGVTVNAPMRAVTGPNWTGAESRFSDVPDQYDALAFHDDDLDDAGWRPTTRFTVPDDLPSGVYAARLRAGGATDWVPFFVHPADGAPTSDIAFLAPTLSYLAYANEHSAADNPVVDENTDVAANYQPEDRYAIAVPVTGLYDHHPDGSGVCYSTWRRPMVNMRPHYRLPLIHGAHQFPADLHLVDWLHHEGFAHDVITDHDLHHTGLALLRRYRVIVTGSHPEYWSTPMLDALESYLAGGGRVMYLGGNGFYWVTSVDPHRPDRIEVRRGRRGTGTWRSEPGEDFHDTTGELGGLWRDRGRAPQRLVGVGMDCQGFDRARPYVRTAAAADPRAAWIFARVPAGPIGDAGLVMGGAAGLELDRYDLGLGTPRHALLLASATGFSDSYQHAVEEVASSDSMQGGTVCDKVRADLVYFEGPQGGAVFSTGSITWCGSLSTNDYDNAVSRITGNVLRRFATDGPPGPAPAP